MTKLYVIGWDAAGPVKVGRSFSPEDRVAALQIGCPYPLQVFATGTPVRRGAALDWNSRKLEQLIHRRLADKRLRGEWFQAGVDEVTSLFVKGFTSAGHIDWQTKEVSKA